jgi:hypothetical protein
VLTETTRARRRLRVPPKRCRWRTEEQRHQQRRPTAAVPDRRLLGHAERPHWRGGGQDHRRVEVMIWRVPDN